MQNYSDKTSANIGLEMCSWLLPWLDGTKIWSSAFTCVNLPNPHLAPRWGDPIRISPAYHVALFV